MKGYPLFLIGLEQRRCVVVGGMLDPARLDQRGAAPGALIFPTSERKTSAQS